MKNSLYFKFLGRILFNHRFLYYGGRCIFCGKLFRRRIGNSGLLDWKHASDWGHFSNLYDETTNSFFIPYHLWSGSKWDGDKTAKNCLGEVKNTWKFLNARNKQVKSQVSGPISFTHPISGINFKTYEWKSKRGSQHLICHEKGMARIYDFRFDEAGLLDSPILNGKECKFPAGFG